METFDKKTSSEKKTEEIDPRKKIEATVSSWGLCVSHENPGYIVEQQNAERDFSIDRLMAFFERHDFAISSPMSIKLENATTLFVSSGVQKLENTIHKEDVFPETPLFVNQPVLRSQFLGSQRIESHTSFHNITTVDINLSVAEHLSHFKKWIDFLLSSGFLKENFTLLIKETNPKIGDIRYNNFVIKVYYGGLEIGDAVYIPVMPQRTRPSFSISDIGFGLERLEHDPMKVHSIEKDCIKTLVLLGMSGVKPSNNNHGYRFRLFSKRLVSECGMDYSKMSNTLLMIPEMMSLWLQDGCVSPVQEDVARLVTLECQRNFNREILNYLKVKHGYLNEININQETNDFLDQLERIGDRRGDFWLDFRRYISINP